MSLTEVSLNIPTEHVANVFGQFDSYIKKIERNLNVTVVVRGDNMKFKTRKHHNRTECKLCIILGGRTEGICHC